MSHYYTIPLVDHSYLAEARRMIGAGLPRIVGYFQEDGAKAILAIEEALHARSARDMVLPAHKLKGESRQFGAARLGEIAETIEMTARSCLEKQTEPEGIASEVAMLRGCFAETMALLGADGPVASRVSPPSPRPTPLRPAVFGRKTG